MMRGLATTSGEEGDKRDLMILVEGGHSVRFQRLPSYICCQHTVVDLQNIHVLYNEQYILYCICTVSD